LQEVTSRAKAKGRFNELKDPRTIQAIQAILERFELFDLFDLFLIRFWLWLWLDGVWDATLPLDLES
jgi:hypothetical protein